jgi:hypothetical protein
MRRSQRPRWPQWSLILGFALGFAFSGCSDDGGSSDNDAGSGADDAGAQADTRVSVGRDSGSADDDAGSGKDGSADGGGSEADAAPSFNRELTLGLDDGLPAVKLTAETLSKGHTLIEPPVALLPLKVLEVRFLAARDYSATLSIDREGSGGRPGSAYASKGVSTTAASSRDDWTTVDLRDENIIVNGNFWVTLSFPATMDTGDVLYGGASASGNNYYAKPPRTPFYTVNFDQIIRVVVATGDENPATPGEDGADCTMATDCASGLCLAGKCSVTCSGSCTGGRECRSFELGVKACVTPCTKTGACPAGAFCLTDTSFIDPAGICVDGGPYANGTNCTFQYHTICQSGNCGACSDDPQNCDSAGSCQ